MYFVKKKVFFPHGAMYIILLLSLIVKTLPGTAVAKIGTATVWGYSNVVGSVGRVIKNGARSLE